MKPNDLYTRVPYTTTADGKPVEWMMLEESDVCKAIDWCDVNEYCENPKWELITNRYADCVGHQWDAPGWYPQIRPFPYAAELKVAEPKEWPNTANPVALQRS